MTTTLEPTTGLARYGACVADDLQRRFATAVDQPYLDAPMRDYPSRGGKALRPSMCLASCEAFGGPLDDALPSAVAIELLHNAFLVHDDIEDASLLRRGEPTLHRRFGTPLALNAGDGLALQAMATLRENIDLLGPRLADRIMVEFDFMSQQTVAGQALELGWCRDNRIDLSPDDYLELIMKKTCWYTTVLPLRVGALVGSRGTAPLDPMIEFGFHLGAAFQIRDDILNLVGDPAVYGKEALGDLLEGKRTLMLIHLLASAEGADRSWLVAYLGRPAAERSRDGRHRGVRADAVLREHRLRQRVRHRRGAVRHGLHGCGLCRPRRHTGAPLHCRSGALHDRARLLIPSAASGVACAGPRATRCRRWDHPAGRQPRKPTRPPAERCSGSPVRWRSSPVRRPTRASADPVRSAWPEKAPSVVINGRDADRVATTEAAFRAEGHAVVGVVGSMDNEDAVALLTDKAMEAFGRIDLLVSTVGGAPYALSFDTISEAQLLETVRLNTWPTVALIRAALARGLSDNRGSVVTISSGSPRKTTSSMVAYAAAKAALNAMTRTIAADLAGKGVRVNAVSPGLVRTTATRPMWKTRRRCCGRVESPSGPADGGRRHRRCGLLPPVRRRPPDHRHHARRRRREPPLQWLDADPLLERRRAPTADVRRVRRVRPRCCAGPERRWTRFAAICSRTCSGSMPGSCTRRFTRVGSDLVHSGGQSFGHVARVIGRDRLVRAERGRVGGVALVDGPLLVHDRDRTLPSQTRRIRTLEPVPPASSIGGRQTGQTLGSRHPLHEKAGTAPGRSHGGRNRHRGTEHGDGRLPAGEECRVPLELAQLLAPEHGDEPGKLRLEAVDRSRPG